MKVSFDLDGTAWKYRAFFKMLAHALKNAGHEVGILTMHGDDIRESDLMLWRARGFPEPDFYYNHVDIRKVISPVPWTARGIIADTLNTTGADGNVSADRIISDLEGHGITMLEPGTPSHVRHLKNLFAAYVGIDCHIDDYDGLYYGGLELTLIDFDDESSL